jgi:hypothetical protein
VIIREKINVWECLKIGRKMALRGEMKWKIMYRGNEMSR